MKLKTLILLAFVTIATLGQCGQSGDDFQIDPDFVLPGQEDVNAPDYWNDAEIVWNDEFDGTSISLEKWKFETGDHGWGNEEWQNYVEGTNVEISNGTLKIKALKTGEGQKVGDYTSTRLNSRKSFTYGRLEIRAKIPELKGNGLWPALWMLGENIATVGWPKCGEIDMMEYVSYDPDIVHFTIHSEANNHKIGTQKGSGPVRLETIEEEFHNYGILWTSQSIKFYVDEITNVKYTFEKPTPFNQDNWPFDKPFYFLMNIAVGGAWGGAQGVDDSIFPSQMEVDYVRVYQKP